MEGRDPTPISNEAILRRIKGFVQSLVVDLSSNRCPSFVLDRYRSYCSDTSGDCACGSGLPCGKEIFSLEARRNACRMQILLRVLLIIQQLLLENKHASKRDIYYMEPSVFTEPGVVNQAINEICILLECSHHHLNVVPVGRGLVMGWLRYVEAGRRISCITNLNTAYMIPVSVEEVEDIVSVAHYILVVEKETGKHLFHKHSTSVFFTLYFLFLHFALTAVFQRLANDKFCERNHCIVITQMAYNAKSMRVLELRWLGVFPSDFKEYQLPDCCLLNLTTEDKKKAEAILSRCYLHQEAPKWRLEMEIMLLNGVKFEIEALSASSLSFLSECYIPIKIQKGCHI